MLNQKRFAMLLSVLTLGILGCTLAIVAQDAATTKPAKGALKEMVLDESKAFTLKAEKNGFPANTKLIPSGNFDDNYVVEVLVDGKKNRKEMPWQEAAWASAETEEPQGIQINLGKPMQGGRFQVAFAYDAGSWYTSRNFRVQVKAKETDAWKDVAVVDNNKSVIGSFVLPEDESFSFIRLYQPVGGGYVDRPNLLWLGQIEITE